MQAGTDGKVEDAGAGFAGSRDGIDDDAIVGDFNEATSWLPQKMEFRGAALGLEGDGFTGTSGGHGNAGQAVHAVGGTLRSPAAAVPPGRARSMA